jgi:hypothetical protein
MVIAIDSGDTRKWSIPVRFMIICHVLRKERDLIHKGTGKNCLSSPHVAAIIKYEEGKERKVSAISSFLTGLAFITFRGQRDSSSS